MESWVGTGDTNIAYLQYGVGLIETKHRTFSQTGQVTSTSGRVVTVEAAASAQMEIITTTMDHSYYNILFCAEFIPKM